MPLTILLHVIYTYMQYIKKLESGCHNRFYFEMHTYLKSQIYLGSENIINILPS